MKDLKLITVTLGAVLLWISACSDDTMPDITNDSGISSQDMSPSSDMPLPKDATQDLDDLDQGPVVTPKDANPDLPPQEDMDQGTTPPDMTEEPFDPIVLPSSTNVNSNHRATAEACSSCHSSTNGATAMHDAQNRKIGFYDLWQASMMANSARDPFWRAMVATEVKATPSLEGAIEDKCMTCHAPMRGTSAEIDDLLTPSDTASLGLDGVNCTTCHQIKPDNLGSPESFDGHFELALNGQLYGPHSQPFTNPMVMNSGFTPTASQHILESELCATCHTLSTTTYTPDGQPTGHTLAEQMPYIEWQNSEYAQGAHEQSCQDCHVPRVSEDGTPIMTRIARRPNASDFTQISDRALGRHLFIGGNTLIPQILRDNRADLNPRADDAAFDALIAAVTTQLTESTAHVGIETVSMNDSTLGFDVLVNSDVGHKFPSGFPSRRAWLKVVVRNAQGNPIFTSGDYNDRGQILNGTTPHAFEQVGGPVEPHHDSINDPAMVQVYEAIMQGVDNEPAWRLLRGATYMKDNRLLPRGWNTVFADIDKVQPVGPHEANFAGGQDRVHYEVTIPDGSNATTIEVELLYQPLSTRFASELFAAGSDLLEVKSFKLYWEMADKKPVTVSSMTFTIN